MVEIDVIKEYSNAKKIDTLKTIKDFLVSPYTYIFLTTNFIGSYQSVTLGDNLAVGITSKLVEIASSFGLLVNYLKIAEKKDDFLLDKTLDLIADKLRKTDTYERLLKNYNCLTTEIAKLLKDLDVNDNMEKCYVLSTLLDNGYFSKTSSLKFESRVHDMFMLQEVYGARICSGQCVCRHAASFVSDILEKTGSYAVPLETVVIDPNRRYSDDGGEIKLDHMVVGVSDGNKRFVFDPTNSMFGLNYNGINHGKDILLSDAVSLSGKKCDGQTFYIPLDQELYKGGTDRVNSFNHFINDSFISGNDMKQKFDKCIKIVKECLYLIDKFYLENIDLINEIVHDDEIIAPYGDKDIKKWTLD